MVHQNKINSYKMNWNILVTCVSSLVISFTAGKEREGERWIKIRDKQNKEIVQITQRVHTERSDWQERMNTSAYQEDIAALKFHGTSCIIVSQYGSSHFWTIKQPYKTINTNKGFPSLQQCTTIYVA